MNINTEFHLSGRVGANANRAALTQKEAERIREIYAAKKTPMRILALRFDVSAGTISNIINGKHYPE